MAKKIKLWENTVVTKDDKGNLVLVGYAKEALTSFDKMKIGVDIHLHDHSKEEIEKLLKENEVPYGKLIPAEDKAENTDYDLCIVAGNVLKLYDWKWTAEEIIRKLYDKSDEKQESEQESMNKRLEQIKKYTQERAKKKVSDPYL